MKGLQCGDSCQRGGKSGSNGRGGSLMEWCVQTDRQTDRRTDTARCQLIESETPKKKGRRGFMEEGERGKQASKNLRAEKAQNEKENVFVLYILCVYVCVCVCVCV